MPPKNNKNAQLFKTPAERQKAYHLYCCHIADGFDVKSFHKPCSYVTIMKMLKEYPDEFNTELLEQAKCAGRYLWEVMGKEGAAGKIKGFNPSAWWRIAQNKLGWTDNVQHSNDKENPLSLGGAGALTPLQEAILDHIGKKLLYERNMKASSQKELSTPPLQLTATIERK